METLLKLLHPVTTMFKVKIQEQLINVVMVIFVTEVHLALMIVLVLLILMHLQEQQHAHHVAQDTIAL